MLVTVVSSVAVAVAGEADSDLIARTLSGDEAAFGALMERYQRKIYRVALAILRDHAEADVVTHETFVQAYFHLSRFERRSELETWLTRIAINKSRDQLRKRKFVSLDSGDDHDGEAAPLEFEDAAPDAERLLHAKELRQVIDDAIESLSAQQKMIFRLRHYEEMSMEEIGAALGLQAATVRVHLFRAVHKVREKLAAVGWRTRLEAGS